MAAIYKMNNKIHYIADLDNSSDDLPAIEYIHAVVPELLEGVIVTPPKTTGGKERLQSLQILFNKARALNISNIEILDSVPSHTDILICNSSFTPIVQCINSNTAKIDTLVINSMYNSNNSNEKYEHTKYIESEKLNRDLEAVENVLNDTRNTISYIYSIGIDTSDIPDNTTQGLLWKDDNIVQNICKRYKIHEDVPLSNILMCHEAINLAAGRKKATRYCYYTGTYPIMYKIDEKIYWGSISEDTKKYKLWNKLHTSFKQEIIVSDGIIK